MTTAVDAATPNLRDKTSYPHWRTDIIRFGDLDPIGHVNNVAYVSYFESGRVMFFSELGCRVNESDFAWMIVRIEVNYLQQMSLPGEVVVGTGVVDIGSSSVRLSHAVFADEICAAQGECVMVMVDRTRNRASPFSDEVRAQLSAMRCGG